MPKRCRLGKVKQCTITCVPALLVGNPASNNQMVPKSRSSENTGAVTVLGFPYVMLTVSLSAATRSRGAMRTVYRCILAKVLMSPIRESNMKQRSAAQQGVIFEAWTSIPSPISLRTLSGPRTTQLSAPRKVPSEKRERLYSSYFSSYVLRICPNARDANVHRAFADAASASTGRVRIRAVLIRGHTPPAGSPINVRYRTSSSSCKTPSWCFPPSSTCVPSAC